MVLRRYTTPSTRKLGVAKLTGATGNPPVGVWQAYDECPVWSVNVPGLPVLTVESAVKEPDATEIGTIVLNGGADGTFYWASAISGGNQEAVEAILDDLVDKGYRVIQNKWQTNGWSTTTGPNYPGSALCAARSATLLVRLWRRYCKDGVDNLILGGQSGGSTQAAYILGRYGLWRIVKVACFSAGPPHGGELKTCNHVPGYYPLSEILAGENQYDRAFGFPGNDLGPCAVHSTDPKWQARWLADQPQADGTNLYWPGVRTYFQWGGDDTTGAVAGGRDFVAELRKAGGKTVTETIPGQFHSFTGPGLTRYASALRGEPTLKQRVEVASAIGGAGQTTVTTTFTFQGAPSLPESGSLMVCVTKQSLPAAQTPTPAGWERGFEYTFATSHSIIYFFRVTRNATVINKALTSNVATLTTLFSHEFEIGQPIFVSDVGAPFDVGPFEVTAITDNTVSYAVTNADIAPTIADGTAIDAGIKTVALTEAQHIVHHLYEIQHLVNPVVDLTGAIVAQPAAGETVSLPSTAIASSMRQYAIATIGVSSVLVPSMSGWTDGFVSQNSTTKVQTAVRSLWLPETLEPSAVASIAGSLALTVVSFKNG